MSKKLPKEITLDDVRNAKTLSKAIRLARKRKGMNVQRVSAHSGVAVGTVERIERGGNSSMRNFQAVAITVGLPVECFYLP